MSTRVPIRNTERTIQEMDEMWHWVTSTFGAPGENSNYTWTFGKVTPGYGGRLSIDGSWDIEYFDFQNPEDATMFILRWV